jgi:putative peptidoglycan lipid II flippase
LNQASGSANSKGVQISGRGAFRGALVTAIWTLVSRILGFARDAFMLAVFGASAQMGNFVIAWMVPNLFRRLFGEGVVSAAVQPALARAHHEAGLETAGRLYGRFQGLLILVLLCLIVLGEALLLWLLNSASDANDRQALQLTAWLLPYVLPICLTALASAPQQLSGRFSFPAMAPALLNIVWISWLALLEPDASILWLPLGVLVGGVVQWNVQFRGLKAAGWPILPRFDLRDPRLRATILAFGPAVLGLAAVQLNLIVDQILVRELVSEQANSFTYAANRLLQLPMALVGISAATAAMPLFAKLASENRKSELTTTLQRSCEMTFLLMLAAGGGLFVLATPTIQVLFEHGRFSASDTEVLVPVLRAYLWSLPAIASLGLVARVRQASGDLRGPARWALAAVPINLVLDILLLPRFGVAGAGYATAIALSFQTIMLTLGLPTLEIGPPIRRHRLWRLILPGSASTAAAWATFHGSMPWLGSFLALFSAIGIGVLVAAIVAHLVLPEESSLLLKRFKGRSKGGGTGKGKLP